MSLGQIQLFKLNKLQTHEKFISKNYGLFACLKVKHAMTIMSPFLLVLKIKTCHERNIHVIHVFTQLQERKII